MKTQKITSPAKELIFSDDARISSIQTNIEIAKPVLQSAIDTYNAIDGLEPLNDFMIAGWINDPDQEIEACLEYFYDKKYGESHRAIGIGPEKGSGLVHDKMPDLTPVKQAFAEYALLGGKFNTLRSVDIPISTFHYENDVLSVNDYKVEQMTAANQFYLEYPLEFQYRNQLAAIMDAINKLDEVGSKIHPTLKVFDTSNTVTQYNVPKLNIDNLFKGFKKDYTDNIAQGDFKLDITFFPVSKAIDKRA